MKYTSFYLFLEIPNKNRKLEIHPQSLQWHIWCPTIWSYTKTFIWVKVMVFNATFNNISDISLWSVLLVEETGVPSEKH
jgi:hypothetical protein